MSQSTGVFICPSCQSLVQSNGPLKNGVICGECGHEFGKPVDSLVSSASKPVTGVPQRLARQKNGVVSRDIMAKRALPVQRNWEPEDAGVPVKLPEVGVGLEDPVEGGSRADDEETIMPDGTRRVRRRKKRAKKEDHKNLILIVVGCLTVTILAFAVFKLGGNSNDKTKVLDSPDVISERTVKREVLKRHYPQVLSNFKKFLSYPTNEGREQFISNSAELSLPFTRHYRQHSFPNAESKMKPIAGNVIKLSETDYGIEMVWEDVNGNRIGAVYLWDGEAWKIDWENFARYSTGLWSRFRAKLGKKEGTFRLLVRKRETDDETEEFYLSFYRPPLLNEEADVFRVTESPDVRLETKSALGQKFLDLWNSFKAGETPYDSILGESLDPENYLRVTAVLAWEENGQNENVMVLKDIVGVAWFGEVIQELHDKNSQVDLGEEETVLVE